MSFYSRLIALFRPQRLDAELDDEIEFHLNSRIEQFLADGMPAAEARRRALVAFHGPERVKEECRDADRVRWIEIGWRDFRYAVRNLRSSPLFTAAAILSLALGIGANTAVFSLLYASLWKPLPVRDPAQIYHLMRGNPANPEDEPSYSYPLYHLIADAAQPYAEVLAKTSCRRVEFGLGPTPTEHVVGEAVSGNYFSALRVDPALGRVIAPADDSALGGNRIAILSYTFWTRRFAADPTVLGRTIYFKETPYSVAGVAARGFSGVESETGVDVWVPASTDLPRNALSGPNYNVLRLLARLHTGVDPARLQAAVDHVFRTHLESVILPRLPLFFRQRSASQHIKVRPASAGFSVLGRKYERPLLILLAVVALVLLISCANVANLILARNSARAHEIGVRLALGAGRTRIFGQLLAESLLLAVAGAAAGAALAFWGCRLIVGLLPHSAIPVAYNFTPNLTVLAFAASIAVFTALLFGVAPALRAIRGSDGALVKGSARSTTRTVAPRLLVAGQLAVTLLLLIGAGLFLGTVRNFRDTDLGFPSDRLTTFSIALPRATPPARVREMYANIRGERFEPNSACSADARSLTLDLTSAASQPPDPDRGEYCPLPYRGSRQRCRICGY